MSSYAEKADTRRPIRTPEGSTLTVRVAGPVPRVIAWTIDLIIRLLGYIVLLVIFSTVFSGNLAGAAFALTLFAGEWLFYSLFEGLHGATPGKKRCGLVVVQRDGSPCGLEAAFVRNIVRFVDFLPPFYGFGLASMALSADFQRLGDRAAGTLVVYGNEERTSRAPRKKRRKERRIEASAPPVEAAPLPVALTGEEEAAVSEFARRAPIWGDARADELAELAEPLTGLRGAASRKRLLQYAQWLEERGR